MGSVSIQFFLTVVESDIMSHKIKESLKNHDLPSVSGGGNWCETRSDSRLLDFKPCKITIPIFCRPGLSVMKLY